jgi:thiamine-phosphate pyrophosphorylase
LATPTPGVEVGFVKAAFSPHWRLIALSETGAVVGVREVEADRVAQLYVIVEADEGARERAEAALGEAGIACLLIAPPAAGTLAADRVKPLIEAAQAHEVAALVADDVELARIVRADGVHLGPRRDLAEAYEGARSLLGQRAIVGVDAGISRHDAMTSAEAGADYIAFGAPAHLKDRDKARARRDELIAWWAEIFEVPCVALDIETPREAEELARAGADFIAIRLAAGVSPAAARDLVADIAAALAVTETAG